MSINSTKSDLIRRINSRLNIMNLDELTQLAGHAECRTESRYTAWLLASKPVYGSAVAVLQAERGLPPTGHASEL